MAPRPKSKATKSVLGNDPFQRGAAPAVPAPVTLAEREQAVARELAQVEVPAPEVKAPAAAESAARPRTRLDRPAVKPAIQPRPTSTGARKSTKPNPAVRPSTRGTAAARPVTAPQELVKHVHVPEVHSEPEPTPQAPPPRREGAGGSALEQLGGLAFRQAQSLLGTLAASPTALKGVAAAVSGVTAVRALVAGGAPGPRTVDDFGQDPQLVARAAPTLDFLYRHYFRVSVEGAEHLPRHGPVLAIGNHAGALPLDGPILRSALERSMPGVRARWLVEDAIFHAPFVGTWLNRLGAVRAHPENAQRLLEGGAALAVFPEGIHALTKTYRRRYQLQRFGRGGFVKLALRTRTPLIPTAVLGAEESMPILATLPASALGLPVLPLTPSLLPLPAKWTVAFLAPIDLSKYGPDDAQDLALVQRLTEEVRAAIHGGLERLRAARHSIFRS